jgi:transcriptional regulator GlxA family with amidase domain
MARNAISALCVAPSDDAVSDILAKLQPERRRMSAIRTSGLHEPSPIEPRRVYQFFRIPWSSPRSSLHNRLSSTWKQTDTGSTLASVCSGALLLAEAGLLVGRTAATHWREPAELSRRFPSIKVDAESRFVNDGMIWTSAGVTSGIDLALAIIQRDYGIATARRVAQIRIVTLHAPSPLQSVSHRPRRSRGCVWRTHA